MLNNICNITTAVGQDGQALRYADVELRDEPNVVLAAWDQLQQALARQEAHVEDLVAELERVKSASAAKDQRIEGLENRLQWQEHRVSEQARRIAELEMPQSLLPQLTSLASSLQGIDTLEVGQRIKFPVWGLRWTQTSVSRKWQFKNGSSIFKLVMDLHRNRVTPEGLTEREPLRVYAHQGPDGWGLYSHDNRRLVALLMYQACRVQIQYHHVPNDILGRVFVAPFAPAL